MGNTQTEGVIGVTEAQLQDTIKTAIKSAISDLKLDLQDRSHGIEMQASKNSTELNALISRFESEMGHCRREIGDVLKATEALQRCVSDLEMRTRAVETLQREAHVRNENIAEDVEVVRTIAPQVQELRVKEEQRAEADRNRTLNIRLLWGAVATGGFKVLWDLIHKT